MHTHPFLRHFHFTGHELIGVERERFVLRGGLVSGGASFLANRLANRPGNDRRFSPELSDCQLEDRTIPTYLHQLGMELGVNDEEIQQVADAEGFETRFMPVAPPDIPLLTSTLEERDRYDLIRRRMTDEQFRAASRVAATHIHYGMPNLKTAIQVHDALVDKLGELVQMGDTCNGERLRLYLKVAPYALEVPRLGSIEGFCTDAEEHGWVDDPRSNHRLIRISPHGTVELRMFDATSSNALVQSWAEIGKMLCEEALFKSAA